MTASARSSKTVWTALLVLATGFLMSQAFRTLGAIMAAPLQADLHLSPEQLGVFAAAYHFAFGGLQLFMGIGIDMHGLRRTVLVASPLMAIGSAVSALATGFPMLVAGQVLIGVGCAPAFLVCTIFIAKYFAAERYTMVSSIILAVGGIGMLLTGTPLAWLIDASSWRMGFWVLAVFSVLSWVAIARWMHEPTQQQCGRRESLGEAIRTFGQLFRLPHTAGIVAISLVTYASFITLRGLWLGPVMAERYGWNLIDVGNLAVVVTIVALLALPLFGRADPGPRRRRRWLFGGTLLCALLFAGLAAGAGAWVDAALMFVFAAVSGYGTLQYPDVKDAYEPAVIGRAMALFTMSMFMGVALMQWATGMIASLAQARGVDPFGPVFASIAVLLALGALAYRWLPQPPSVDQ